MLWVLEFDRDDEVNGIKSFNRSAHLNGPAGGGVLHAGNVLKVPSKMPDVFISHVFFIALSDKIASVCFRGQWGGVIPHLLQSIMTPTHTPSLTSLGGQEHLYIYI